MADDAKPERVDAEKILVEWWASLPSHEPNYFIPLMNDFMRNKIQPRIDTLQKRVEEAERDAELGCDALMETHMSEIQSAPKMTWDEVVKMMRDWVMDDGSGNTKDCEKILIRLGFQKPEKKEGV